MYKDHDLMEQLNDLSSADMPLTGAELSRPTKTVLKQVGREQKRKKSRHAGRGWPVWSRVLTSGAACVLLLAGVNGFNPVLAESLPVLGDVFAYINRLDKAQLQSGQLDEYARQAQVQAQNAPESLPEDAPKAMAAQQDGDAGTGDALHPENYTLTLRQIYCDELYLRVGLVLTAEDDSLAGFDAVTIDPPLLDETATEAEANALYGGVTLNGQPVSCDMLPRFSKQDDHTFVCELDYNLAGYTGNTQDMQAEITLSDLVGVVYSGEGEPQQTPLNGIYALSFTASANETLTRMGTFGAGSQNGITLQSVATTPGETCVTYSVAPQENGVSPALQVFTADGASLEPAKELRTEEEGTSVFRAYLDAAPEGAAELTVRFVDKNREDLPLLAEWTVTLPR